MLLEKALRLAQRHARHSNKPRLPCFLLGSVCVDAGNYSCYKSNLGVDDFCFRTENRSGITENQRQADSVTNPILIKLPLMTVVQMRRGSL